MAAHFFVTIVTSTAEKYLKQQQELEMAERLSALNHTSAAYSNGAADGSLFISAIGSRAINESNSIELIGV
jgi:hypothetical protein